MEDGRRAGRDLSAVLAEVELRRAGDQLRGLDAAAGTGEWSDPGMAPFAAAESGQWWVVRAGRILAAAGALDRDFLDGFAGELFSPSRSGHESS